MLGYGEAVILSYTEQLNLQQTVLEPVNARGDSHAAM